MNISVSINDYLIKYICIVCYLKLILKIKKYRNYWVLINAYWIRLRFVKYRFVRYRFVNRHYLQKKNVFFRFSSTFATPWSRKNLTFIAALLWLLALIMKKKKEFLFFISLQRKRYIFQSKWNLTRQLINRKSLQRNLWAIKGIIPYLKPSFS